jgi:hypothetical protein
MSNKFECRAGPTLATRAGPSVCPHCEETANNLFQAIAQRHSDKEAARIFSRIIKNDFPFSAPFARRDFIRHDNTRLLEDFDAAMKANQTVAAFVKARATQNSEMFKAYDAAKKSGKRFDALACDDKYGRLPPFSRRGAGSTDPAVLRRHLDKLRRERRSGG